MEYRYEYKTAEERAKVVSDNIGKVLVEEQNLSTGNFLVFADEPRQYVIKMEPIDIKVEKLEQLVADLASLQLGV